VTFPHAGPGEGYHSASLRHVEARLLQSDERALLDFLLRRDFPGRTELVAQAETVRTAGLSCSCGCPSFSLVADRSLPAAAIPYSERMVSEAGGTDPCGNLVGVLLFTLDGYLADIEVYPLGDGRDGLPRPESLQLS
jgi:hypothetical protein